MNQDSEANAIELRVQEISQLFNTLDPFPFRERDLDRNAEEFIVGWAQELTKKHPIRIIVHLPAKEAAALKAGELAAALTRYFDYRAGVTALDIHELFRVGRRSLAIGVGVLALCLAATQLVATQFGAGPIDRFFEESLILVGWVANWKPIEIFLYDWWPLARRRDLYRRLSTATVELRSLGQDNGR